jgi:hypothetical protein
MKSYETNRRLPLPSADHPEANWDNSAFALQDQLSSLFTG